MLFKDILETTKIEIEPDFDKLIDLVLKNQTHDGDLLLVNVNGHYNADVNNWTIEPKLSPYMIGQTMAGYSNMLHYEFIHKYRTQAISKYTHPEYLAFHKYTPERSKEIDDLVDEEGLTIQLEMLIYLKIWEGDIFIKRLYQIVRLATGEPYDWHFRLAESNRDKTATGTREFVIRELIRNKIRDILPNLYTMIENTYISQIRNSIAHSNYSFLGRGIGLNNYIENEKANSKLRSITFDQWITIFHNTMVIYNEMIRIENQIQALYEDAAKLHHNLFTIRINRKDPVKKEEFHHLKLRLEYHDWNWAQNEK